MSTEEFEESSEKFESPEESTPVEESYESKREKVKANFMNNFKLPSYPQHRESDIRSNILRYIDQLSDSEIDFVLLYEKVTKGEVAMDDTIMAKINELTKKSIDAFKKFI